MDGNMMMGRARLVLAIALACAVSVTGSGCRKLGFDETPRTIPADVPANLGPKRAPEAQHSEKLNTSAAEMAAARGLLSPDPAMNLPTAAPQPQPVALQQPADSFGAYADNNFWVNGAGWSNTAAAMPTNAAMPSPQMQPPMMMAQSQFHPQFEPQYQQQYQPQPQMQVQPYLPPMAALSAAPSPYQISPQLMGTPMQAPSAYAPPYGGAMQELPLQLTPPPAMAMNQPNMDFPQLQEVPTQPYYRSQNEIAADIADLQNQAQMAQTYQAPQQQYQPPYQQQQAQMQPQPPLQLTPPVQASPVAMDGAGYYSSAQSYAAIPSSQGVQQAYAQPQSPLQLTPPPAVAMAPMEAAFVPPAPVAGVAEAPVMTQDWDRSAYGGAASAPVQLRPPVSPQAQALPSSRYTGRRQPSIPGTYSF